MSANYAVGDYVVYPTHGVGRMLSIETEIIGGCEVKVFVIEFEKNRMKLRLPMAKAPAAGLRALSSTGDIINAFETLKQRFKVRKTIWSRRAQEYELKINSGCLNDVAQVIRELYRDPSVTDQSYSEKLIYQSALKRLCSEIALVEKIDESEAINRVESVLKAA